jgi:hypothetical protein
MARGLLRPWLEPGREPDELIRQQVQAFLIEHLEDPRLRPQRWQEAGEAAANLMRRWLTRASLEAFFSLISEHALDSHWRYREAFWSACIEKSAGAEAWLALGSRIHASARAVEDLKGAYARLEGPAATRQCYSCKSRTRSSVSGAIAEHSELGRWIGRTPLYSAGNCMLGQA